MRGKVVSLMLSLVFVSSIALNGTAAEYDHEIKAKKMDFAWKIDAENMHIKLSAPTTGWVGIGFNPTKMMEGANYILGYVKDGKVKLRDDYGDSQRNHKEDKRLGGTTDLTVVGGEEQGENTTLEFTIPLNSGDEYDTVIDPNGNTVVLLAYGGKRDSFRSKHKYRETININLSSGEVK